jgi:hypothetical protein
MLINQSHLRMIINDNPAPTPEKATTITINPVDCDNNKGFEHDI